uniref:Uncharacterized protein n=1 Tax=Caenorhabditis japonica TaxID=281687 RepID=A0A8R1HID3_CAEJA
MIITGKGPLKAMYLEEIRQKNLVSINILTPWLEAKDYPTIVGSADLGISLHTSTSGLDLPMKVVDMFGAKVPVLAKRFKCIGELVYDGINGRLFDDSEELYEQITELAKGFPADCPDLDMLKNHVRNHNYMPWETMWWKRATIRGVLVPPIRNQDMRRFMILLVILLFVIFLIVAPKWVV